MTNQTDTQPAHTKDTGGTGTGSSPADIAAATQPQPQDSTIQQDASGSTAVETRQTGDAGTSDAQKGGTSTPLFQSDETDSFRSRWLDIQSTFVDDPRHAVEQADSLVAEIMQRLADLFAGERSNLEQQWEKGEDVSTEDLRVALQSYRSFFDRLLSVRSAGGTDI